MLHRVTDVQHFSLLGIYRQVGTVPPEESWGREEMEPSRETQGWAGSARDAALATCVRFVGFFAFFISLSSVN